MTDEHDPEAGGTAPAQLLHNAAAARSAEAKSALGWARSALGSARLEAARAEGALATAGEALAALADIAVAGPNEVDPGEALAALRAAEKSLLWRKAIVAAAERRVAAASTEVSRR
jgi:hypothetical protein